MSGAASLLVPQDGKPLVPVLDIRRYHFQLQAVVQGLQNLLLGVAEIGNFVGRRKEGDRGNGICTALVGVLAFVQRGEQGVEYPVVAFKNFIQETDIRLGNLTGGVDPRLTAVKFT